jgi:hypothetical protein
MISKLVGRVARSGRLAATVGALLIGAAALPVSAIPPPSDLPIDADRLAAVKDLWATRPLYGPSVDWALIAAASELSAAWLKEFENRRAYPRMREELYARIVKRGREEGTELEQLSRQCMARGMAAALTVEQIRDLHRFAGTPSGGAVWANYLAGMNDKRLDSCVMEALQFVTLGHLAQDTSDVLKMR